jgi:hypothetical protein
MEKSKFLMTNNLESAYRNSISIDLHSGHSGDFPAALKILPHFLHRYFLKPIPSGFISAIIGPVMHIDIALNVI